MAASTTRVLCFRLPECQAALVDREAARKGISPAEYMRRAVVRRLQSATLADAAAQAGENHSSKSRCLPSFSGMP